MNWLTRLTAAVRLWWRQRRCTRAWVPCGPYDEACAKCGAPRELFKY